MTKNELFTFIKNFNATQSVSPKTILEGLKTLPESDHELFMLLVNYKNGKLFKQNLDNGEI